MQRRDFIALIGTVFSSPFAAHAQHKPMPVIGFLGSFPPAMSAQIELEQAAFRQGLSETGYVEGQNVTIESRRGEGHLGRLPALAADLVARKVDVIVTQGGDSPPRLQSKRPRRSRSSSTPSTTRLQPALSPVSPGRAAT